MLAKLFISIVKISPFFQKNLWKWWYQRLGNRGYDSGWTFMNYGYLSNDFKKGSSMPTEIYQNDILSSNSDFRVTGLEVWAILE